MLKKFKIKKAVTIMLSIMMLGTSLPAVATDTAKSGEADATYNSGAYYDSETTEESDEFAVNEEDGEAELASFDGFDPETTLWTNRKIESVLAEQGKYETVRDVDPNASNKDSASSDIQTPYGKPGENYTSWAYSEFVWTNYYPVGNGRMASMVAGGIDNEVIQINEDTCWDGGPYGTLTDENGETLTTVEQTRDAGKINAVDMTSGSKKDAWKFYRGANADGTPADIGSSDVIVGDDEFRTSFPEYSSKSISNQALEVDNSSKQTAVQQRFALESMVESEFLGNPSGQRAYKSFVELYLDFGQENYYATDYTKSLDMTTGIVTVDYDYLDKNDNNTYKHFTRETFASYPDQAIVTHVTSTHPLDFTAELHTYHNQEGYYKYEKVSDKQVKVTASVYNGNKNDSIGRINVIRFEADMLLDGDGVFTVSDDNTTVSVNGGYEATVYVVGATNYVDYKTLDNSKPAADCAKYIENIKSKTYETILARHIADFTPQFESSSLTLDNKSGVDNYLVPTEQRVRKNLSNGNSGFTVGTQTTLAKAKEVGVTSTYADGDYQLAVLLFNYGKYMLFSGARDGKTAESAEDIDIYESQPLNLTGKWNAAMSASWNGKYTININTEMNYWAAQPLGIGESERTLIDTFDDLAESGAITAAEQYGIYNDRGDDTYQPGDPWVMHHNYDLWRGTQPIDNATAGLWPTGGAWLLDHAWQYYLYNEDTEYLSEVYPYMVGAAKFFTQFLVIDPKTGYLITAASCSPEQGSVQPGPAMDTQLVRNLYDMVIKASEILGKTSENAELISKINEQMPSSYFADEDGKIAPDLIDSSGYIKEWVRGDVSFDFSEVTSGTGKYEVTNPFTGAATGINEHAASNSGGHRHCSHLWDLFPGTHLSAYSNDENEQKLFTAFKKTTSAKGVGDRSWAYAWRMALNARALNASAANTSLETLITTRTSPNLMTQHPNFQIDGNYGATAAITEMLLQSHSDVISILPALPTSWQSGQFKDFRARGNIGVSAKWSGGKLTRAELKPENDGDINIAVTDFTNLKAYDTNGAEVELVPNADYQTGKVMTLSAEAGETYTLMYGSYNKDEETTATQRPDPTPEPTLDPDSTPTPKPTATPVPTQPPLGDSWVCDSDDASLKTGDYVMKDMSLLYDVDSSGAAKVTIDGKSFTNYISHSSLNGTWSSGAASGTAYKYSATRNGILTVYVTNLGNNKELCITKEGVSSNKVNEEGEAAYYKNETGSAENKSLSLEVTAGNTYYAYVAGSKGRFVGAEFIASDVQPTKEPENDGYSYRINSLTYDNSTVNADVEYIGDGNGTAARLIVAAYTGNGVLISVDSSKELNGTEKISMNFDAPEGSTVKVFIWDSIDGMNPLSASAIVSDVVSTPEPTATLAPSSAPAEEGVYIGDAKYDTITEAVAAAEATNPSSESERVIIDITPGVYREQVKVTKPYITLRKMPDTSGDVKITWYYGLGTLYDSCNSSGYYDKSSIGDGEAYAPKDWGPSLKVDKGATAFIAEDLYLENSYNSYYTQEELTDIAGIDPDTNNSLFPRLDWIKSQIEAGVSDSEINAYLQSRKDITFDGYTGSPRERCAALHCSADKAQFINCTVMSTQDTIGINTGRMYFKNCKLGGTTDYICGSATAVFDGCELYTNSGPKQAESATITAPSNTADAEGYLFWNCKITGNSTSTSGSMGRPWGAAPGPAAYYINTTIGNAGSGGGYLVSSAGWSDMSGNKAEDARFGEYGSVDASGNAISTSGRVKGKVLDEWTMLRYNPYTFTKGDDGWDPAGAASDYTNIEKVISETTINTSDSTTNEVALPEAPSGYEFSWESSSEFATVNGDKLTLIRPAAGENSIKASVKLYARECANKAIGDEKTISFDILPTSDTTNVFSICGTVSLSIASDEEQTVKIEIKKGKAVVKTVNVTVAAGSTSRSYTAENIPIGTYTVTASTGNSDYNILTADTSITGVKGESIAFNVDAKKMVTITAENNDFDITPAITSATGFSAGVYTATGDETANLGAGNVVYKVTKDENKTVAAKTGVSFDLTKMTESGATLSNTKTIKFSFDFLMETIDYYPNSYSYFDLATSTTNAGADKEDQTRFVRWGVYKGWGQFNMFTAKNTRVNGDNTQFDKNSTMANKWYRIVADIDLENQTITSTLYNRDNNMDILNKKAFEIAMPDDDGNNPNYPTNIDLSNLYFNIYMDKSADTTNKIEYYFDNITLEYQDYE